jgi:hypothetical protein
VVGTTLHPFAASGHNHLAGNPASIAADQKRGGQSDSIRLADAAKSCGFLGLHQNPYTPQCSCDSERSSAFRSGLLDFEQEVLVIPVATAPAKHGPDVAVDGLDLPERNLLVAVGKESVEMAAKELSDLVEGGQALPAQRADPRVQPPLSRR